jgi:uncharacterized membrane protein
VNRKNKWISNPSIVASALLAVMAVILLIYVIYFGVISSTGRESWGQFGDYFGGILNPILSFSAFIILVITYNKQISIQQHEDIKHYKSMENSRFFEMLSMLHQTAGGVEIDDTIGSMKTYRGHRGIGRSWNILRRNLDRAVHADNKLEEISASYANWRNKYWPSVGSYFESAIFILDRYVLLNNNQVDYDYYMHALRSQMSIHERSILFFELVKNRKRIKHGEMLEIGGFWDDCSADVFLLKHEMLDLK